MLQHIRIWLHAGACMHAGANDDAGIHAIAHSLGPAAKGKVLIDVTNPLTPWPGLEIRWQQGTSGKRLGTGRRGPCVLHARCAIVSGNSSLVPLFPMTVWACKPFDAQRHHRPAWATGVDAQTTWSAPYIAAA